MATSNIMVGSPLTGTGGVLNGPLGTALPTDTSTELDEAYNKLGFVSDDGVTMTIDKSTDKVTAWGGQTVRIIQTEFDCTFKMQFLETNQYVLKAAHGSDNVTVTAATESAGTLTSVLINAKEIGNSVWVFEIKDGDARIRIVVPNAQVSEIGDVQFATKSVTGRDLTIDALPDDSGNNAYMYCDDGVFAAA